MKQSKKRIILVGKAASGKDYFKDWYRDQGYTVDISYTTRPMRKGEEDGKTYFYVSDPVFLNLKNQGFFHEAVTFATKQYGTSENQWEKGGLFIKTPSGLSQISEEDRKQSYVIYFDMPEDIRKERLSKRSDFDSVERRLKADEEDFKDFTDWDLRVFDPKYDPETVLEGTKVKL
jgi:guanylate kinase